MNVYQVQTVVDGVPAFEKPVADILKEVKAGGAIKILSPAEYHTEQQRRWYKGVCLRELADWNGDTPDEWDLRLKAICNGNELLRKEQIYIGSGRTVDRLTTVGVCKKNFTAFIENILSKSIEMDWPVDPPDPELRK